MEELKGQIKSLVRRSLGLSRDDCEDRATEILNEACLIALEKARRWEVRYIARNQSHRLANGDRN